MKQSLRNLWLVVMALCTLGAAAYEKPEDYVSNPSNGATVSSLSSFSVGYADGGTATWLGMTDISELGVYNADGVQVSTYDTSKPVNNDPDNKGMVLIPLTKEVTEAGTYTFKIPAGYFMKGFSQKTKNIALEFTFTVNSSFVADLDEIYLVGEPTAWAEPVEANAETYKNWVLTETETGSKVYHGVFEIPAGKAQFRFYDELAGWDTSKQYGFSTTNAAFDHDFDRKSFAGEMVEGQGQWKFPVWYGGKMDITVDVAQMKLRISIVRAEIEIPSISLNCGDDSYSLGYYDDDDRGYLIYVASVPVPAGEFTIAGGGKVFGGETAMTSGEQVVIKSGGKPLTYTTNSAETVSVELLYNPNTDAASLLSLTDIFPVKFVSSNPADGAKLEEGISEIVLTFTEELYTADAYSVGYDPGTEDWTPVYVANVTIADQQGNVNDPNNENSVYQLDMVVDYADTKNVIVSVGDNLGNALPDGTYTLTVNAGCITALNGTTNEAITLSFTIGNPSGVESVAVDTASAAYYDLQGRKVATENLAPGVYVKVQGRQAAKVVVR